MMDLKKVFVLGTVGFIVICLALFYHLTSTLNISKGFSDTDKLDYNQVETKLKSLEEAVKSHQKSMKEIENLVEETHDVVKTQVKQRLDEETPIPVGARRSIEDDRGNLKKINFGKCSAAFALGSQAKSDINMLSLYDKLKFDNLDGGSWKQGWNVKIDETRFTPKDKLKVFVIPHSHNDPGWIKTFERYFEEQTKHILDSMLRKLAENPTMKFVWAEISYFSLWWETIDQNKKRQVLQLVKDKQLEFVTGGWVMPDESSAHYYGMVSQLFEGHQWLFHHLNVIPIHGWSIDPFGMSPTNAYILQRAGLKDMVIQRTHYAVKKNLAESKNLEFQWRQVWDNEGASDILCHMMPFYSYDVPHTCGPEPKVCCQFDFKRMRGVSHMTCPWNAPPVPIIARNVKERSLLLLDQYRKKAMLYRTNTILVPLGDDFRWENDLEWDAQFQNYRKIMDYINSDSQLNAEVNFGTLDDYFKALNQEVSVGKFSPSVLSGDFFTYADRDDHYWSGYFTSRPFHKATDRSLISHLRAAHISLTLMLTEVSKKAAKEGNNLVDQINVKDLLENLYQARRTLGLFQHHDGIAGTAKDHVMVDYGKKLLDAITACNTVMEQSLLILTNINSGSQALSQLNSDTRFYEPASVRDTFDALPHLTLISINQETKQRLVTVYNSVARSQAQLVSLFVSNYNVKVYDMEGKLVETELLPVFGRDQTTVSRNVFELTFVAEMGSLAMRNYMLKYEHVEEFAKPEVFVLNHSDEILEHPEFPIRILGNDEGIQISNEYITAKFDGTGFIESVEVNGKAYPLRIGMHKYGARPKKETSGLYLFLPDGPASKIPVRKQFVRIVRGKFQSYVEVWLAQVKHRVTIYSHPGYEKYSLDVKNWVDIRNEQNFELVMRLQTGVESGDEFFTDLNGFQMIRRKRLSKLPIQANYYPFPTAAYVEDNNLRVSVLSGQPLGASSQASGEFEVILDRRLMQDDERGAAQGDTDNLETLTLFKISLEVPQCHDHERKNSAPMLTLPSHIALENLLHPFHTFIVDPEITAATLNTLKDYQAPSAESLPCDVQLIDSAPLSAYTDPLDDHSFYSTSKFALLVRRLGFDGQFLGGTPLPDCGSDEHVLGQFKPTDFFGSLIGPEAQKMSLTFLHEQGAVSSNSTVIMKPMELYAFRVSAIQ